MRKHLTELTILLVATALIIGLTIWSFRGGEELSGGHYKEKIPETEYGIIVDSLDIQFDRVKRNQFLSDILLSYGVEYPVIDRLVRRSDTIFDVRKIRYGNRYAVIKTRDSIPAALYFIYEIDPTDYVVFSLADSIYAYRGSKPVEIRLRSASGIISSSLWETMIENGTDPNLANELSEIFAWSVDFFGIQPGDNYKVIYEDMLVEGNSIGIGKIHCALLQHMSNDYYAFYFEQGEDGDYFDDEGGSMRRTFLKAPLRFKRISSRFSYSRMHPVLKIRRPHTGIDYAADRGTPVLAVGDGIVIEKGWDRKGGGNYVKIRHNGTYTTIYMHLEGFARGLTTGKRVLQGEVIGFVGSTGLATGPHLDFRFYRNGKPIDPLKVESPPAEPIDTSYLHHFITYRDSLTMLLDTIPLNEGLTKSGAGLSTSK